MSYTQNNWLDLSGVSNLFKSIYVKGFVDISGGDFISRNGNLYIAGNANLNNTFITNNLGIGVSGSSYPFDLSGSAQIRKKLVVLGDVSVNGNIFTPTLEINDNSTRVATTAYVKNQDYATTTYVQNLNTSASNNLSSNYAPLVSPIFSGALQNTGTTELKSTLTVSGDTMLKSRLFITQDASLSGNLYVEKRAIVNGDISANSRLFVGQDASLNGNLYVAKNLSIGGDISMNGNLVVHGTLSIQQTTNTNLINTTTSNYQLIVTEDISLNGRLNTSGDAGFNSRIIVGSDVSLGGRLFVQGTTAFADAITTDGSFNKRILVGSDVSLGGRLFVRGTTALADAITTDASINNRVLVGSDVSLGGRLFVRGTTAFADAITTDGSFNKRVLVGSDVSLGGRLFVSGDSTLGGRLVIFPTTGPVKVTLIDTINRQPSIEFLRGTTSFDNAPVYSNWKIVASGGVTDGSMTSVPPAGSLKFFHNGGTLIGNPLTL
jgi:NF-X1-type zinc finger protein NFXL1